MSSAQLSHLNTSPSPSFARQRTWDRIAEGFKLGRFLPDPRGEEKNQRSEFGSRTLRDDYRNGSEAFKGMGRHPVYACTQLRSHQ